MATEFVAVRHNEDGDLTHFKTADGNILNYDEALALVEQGEVDGVTIGKARNGRTTIRGVADGDPSNNLDHLETF
ncbi:DUF3892 domain-containing protein [Alkalibacillus haloalkaliphilus]|uniref:DUF3892 domain-containing protein n=1 Tax=Alkalibacillus haloalkaliphilus TaxID=94136 RepID=A0A511W9S4_9BACI|nr:DUF3892 domain-containing protein [Alkalibacillus haloalkaliphilus]MDV2583077.1 DUF3892 domain-containing protein [Alkalibacillus haloalkaliphilus]GEN46082.1 hypothetical protein AHA02nite_18580 [Alkalibacillus haloalkaliphilus]